MDKSGNASGPASRDEFIVKRLETFGDIVIGFSLAELGLNLVVPQHASDFYQNPTILTGFIATFALIAQMWWNYTTLFRHFFIPNRIAIIANFAALCGIVLLVFSFQLVLHAGHTPDVSEAAHRIDVAYTINGYCIIFAVTSLFLGGLYLHGLIARWHHLPREVRKTGVNRSTLLILAPAGLACALMCELLSHSAFIVTHSGTEAHYFPTSLLGFIVGLVASRIVRQIVATKLGLNEPKSEPLD